MGRNTYIDNSVLPILNGNEFVPIGTNYCLYLQNSTNVLIHSPVFTTGIGTLYLDAISLMVTTIDLSVYIATNMVNGTGELVPLDATANSNRMAIVWEPAPLDIITLVAGNPEFAYKRELNIRQPTCIKIIRNNMVDYTSRDDYYAVIDNIRVSEPPADVVMDKSAMPFNAYPSVNKNMNVQFRIDNVAGPHATTAALRTNVMLVSRWNYLNLKTSPWTTNVMQCANIGDGAGNGELWQPLTAMPVYPDAGDLEYFFLCYFDGTYYQSYDYTAYPKALDPVLFRPEDLSPRVFSAEGITRNPGTNNPFVFPLRLFPSEHETVTTLLYVNGSETPVTLPMTLVGTNKWQSKYDAINHPDATNLLWYFASTGTFTNAFMTTTGQTYWQNATQRRLQSATLPQSGFFTLTDASITTRADNWFGVTITPGESSFVIFTLDTTKNSYLTGRGEYQNFNAWNTGAAAQNAFTDAVDKYSKISYSQSFTTGWRTSYFTGLSNWFGTVNFAAQTAPIRQGPDPILGQPLYWQAGSFQYVTERTAINGAVIDAETTAQRRNQGIRLLGGSSGAGLGYFQGSAGQQNAINGVGTVTYKARLSRPIMTDPDYNYNVAYRWTDMMRTNYVIKCFMSAVMATPEAPSISIIAYYQGPRRFYEYRIVQLPDARDINGATGVYAGRDGYVAHQIWKWNGSNTPQLLAESKRANTAATMWGGAEAAYDARVTTTQANPTEFRLYTTLTPTPSVSLRVRFQNTDIPFPAGTTTYEVTDSTSPILFGGYGFHSADCPLVVTQMTLNNSAVGAIDGGGTPTVVIGGTSWNQYNEWYWPTELYSLSGNQFAPTAQSTTVKVLTGTTQSGPWTPFATQTVSSYAYQNFSATTNAWNNLCARIQANDSAGVVIDGVRVGSWRGENITASPSDNWKITEGWLNNIAPDGWYAHLDASQADPSMIQGVRSERILGLGSISFDYRVLTPPAQLKIQYTANAVPTDDSDAGWVDVTNLNFAAATGWVNANYTLAVAPATNIYLRVINNIVANRKASIDLRNIVIWNNPTNSPNDWAAYNMKIADTETDKWWLDKKSEATARSGYMNNSTTANTIAGRPMSLFNPYILAPRLTHGLGTISFLARAFTTGYAAGNTNTSISVYASTDEWDKLKPDALWTKLYTFTNITNAFYRPYSYTHPALPNDIKAVKLVVDGVVPLVGTPQRVCMDEIVLTEEVRTGFEITEVKMLKEGSESTLQPFEGESIGIEAQLTRVQSDPQEINLFVTYVLGTNTWGVTNAPVEQRTTLPMTLVSPSERIYRTSSSFIPAQSRGTVVQYCVWGEYADNGTQQVYQSPMTDNHFLTPPWYTEDLNQTRAPDWSPYYRVAAPDAPLWLAPAVQNVPYTGGVFTVFVGALSNWTATTTSPWVMPAALSGSLAGSILCQIAPNALKTARSANLTFTCGLLAETVAIHQDPAPSNLDAVVERTGFDWTMGGDRLWFEQTQTVKEGASALQSGAITNNQQSWVETTITGPGMLSFWWRVSSEGGYDLLTCTLDGIPQKTISGNKTGWVQEQVAIGTGPHVVRWTYRKDGSGSAGNDCGWLDALGWSPENTLSGFALWTSNLGLLGNQPELFSQDRNSDNIANGFEYAFGTNLPLSSLLLNIRFINGKAIVEIPQQDAETLPYVDVRVRGSTNLLDWTLPMIPASDTTGKPSYKSWHETQGTPTEKAFFKLEAELK
jgi:hypothetical protein